MSKRRVVSFYLDVNTRKDQYNLLNTTTLQCIKCYILEDGVGERALKVYKSISGYFSIYDQSRQQYVGYYWWYSVRLTWGKGGE